MRRTQLRDLEEAALKDVRAIYHELEERPIERQCLGRAQCCHFLRTGRTPYLTRGEAVLALKAWRATGRKQWETGADGACPMLDPATLRCRIYAERPFGCRTHFCEEAGGPYRRGEVVDLIRRLEEIDRRLGGEGGRQLQVALKEASREV